MRGGVTALAPYFRAICGVDQPLSCMATPAAGLPVGLTVQGGRFDDRRALRLAERMAETLSNTEPVDWVPA
ncbi:hypothetical protein GCM10027360_21960 [Amycolatopsis echigonensis]